MSSSSGASCDLESPGYTAFGIYATTCWRNLPFKLGTLDTKTKAAGTYIDWSACLRRDFLVEVGICRWSCNSQNQCEQYEVVIGKQQVVRSFENQVAKATNGQKNVSVEESRESFYINSIHTVHGKISLHLK